VGGRNIHLFIIHQLFTEAQVHCPKGTDILVGNCGSLHGSTFAAFYKAVLLTSFHLHSTVEEEMQA
jgi:hypothetical protein